MEDKKRRRFEDEPPGDGSGSSPGEGEAVGEATARSLRVMQQVVSLLKPEDRERILAEAAASIPEVGSMVAEEVGKDKQNRKLFVRGLDFDTTADAIYQVFSPFGKIVEHTVIKDKTTGRSRGFGFVTFASMESTIRALQEPSKLIDGRMSACQLSVAGLRGPQEDILLRKIFVANVHSSLSAERMLEFFSQFGDIDEGPIGYDRSTKRSKGYAIFVYKTIDGASKALQDPSKLIDGHQVFCKLAGDPKGKVAAMQQKHQADQPGMLQLPDAQQQQQQQQQQQLLQAQHAAQAYYSSGAYSTAAYSQAQAQAQAQASSAYPTAQTQAIYTVPTSANGALTVSQSAGATAGQPQYTYATVPGGAVYMSATPTSTQQQAYSTAPTVATQPPGPAAPAGGGYYLASSAMAAASPVPAGPAGYTLLPAGSGQPGLIAVPTQPQHGQAGARPGQHAGVPALAAVPQGYYQAAAAAAAQQQAYGGVYYTRQ